MREGSHQARLAVGPLALECSLKGGDTRHDMRAGLIEQLGRLAFNERFEQVESTQVGGCQSLGERGGVSPLALTLAVQRKLPGPSGVKLSWNHARNRTARAVPLLK